MPGNALLLAGEKLEPDLVNLKRWQQKKMQSKHEIDGGDKNPDAGSLTPDWHSFAGARFLHPGPAQENQRVAGARTGDREMKIRVRESTGASPCEKSKSETDTGKTKPEENHVRCAPARRK
jgi:hypothetical protein